MNNQSFMGCYFIILKSLDTKQYPLPRQWSEVQTSITFFPYFAIWFWDNYLPTQEQAVPSIGVIVPQAHLWVCMFVFNAICSGQPTFIWKGFLCLLCGTIVLRDEISFRPGQGEIAIRDLIVAALILIVGDSSPRRWIGNSCIVYPHKAFGSIAKNWREMEVLNMVAAFSWQDYMVLIALCPVEI